MFHKKAKVAILLIFCTLGFSSPLAAQENVYYQYGYYKCYTGDFDNSFIALDWFFSNFRWENCGYGSHYDRHHKFAYQVDTDLFVMEKYSLFSP